MYFMKIKGYLLCAVTLLLLVGCAEEPSESARDNELLLVSSTAELYFPNATPMQGYDDGSLWVISHAQVGTGSKPMPGSYVAFDYTGKLLPISQSKIFQTTSLWRDSLLGTFSTAKHYAPYFLLDTASMPASLLAMLQQMSVGDTAKVLSASWLASGTTGPAVPANTPVIFTLILREVVSDPRQRELDMVQRYVDSVNTLTPGRFVQGRDYENSLLPGFYISYTDTVPLADSAHYAEDLDDISVKYEGHYLQDNFLLDTNIDSVAKAYGWSITTTDSTYFTYVFSEDASSTAVIKAFQYAVRHVAPGSWVEVVFTSNYGYGKTGSSQVTSRPVYAYTPLRYRIYVAKID